MKYVRLTALLISGLLSVFGTCAGQTSSGPDLYILSIGVRHYKNYAHRDPLYADKDAREFTQSMEQTARASFSQVHSALLTNEQATKPAITAAIKKIILNARATDTFVFFYSGHGESVDDKKGRGSQFYLVPSGYDARRPNLDSGGISAAQLQYWFLQIECEHQFVAFDSSKSNSGFQDFKNSIDRENQRLVGLAHRDIVIVSIRNWSFEFPHMQNGLLTSVILRGLKGAAALPSGEIGAKGLAAYVNTEMPVALKQNANARGRAIMREYPGSGRPFVYESGEDFPLGSVSGTTGGAESRRSNGPSNVSFDDSGFVDSTVENLRYVQNPKCVYSTRPSTSNSDRKGKDLALLIAGNNYDHWDRLTNPVYDAETLADILHDRYDFETEVLKNPDNDCIDDAVKRFAAKDYKPDSQLFVFYAGHGIYLDNVQTGFIIAKDSRGLDDDVFGRSFLPHALFRRMIGAIKCKHILLVMDACQSGTIDDRPGGQDAEPESGCEDDGLRGGNSDEEFVARLLACRTREFITSGDKEYVPDGEPGKHSPFASAFLQALSTDNGKNPFLSLTDIYPVIRRGPRILPRRGYWGGDRGRGDFLFFVH